MVGLCHIPHLNQDTQSSIESYHGALNFLLYLEIKSLKGRHINWLVWKLTTIVAQHYMHQVEMKIQGFIKNKGMA